MAGASPGVDFARRKLVIATVPTGSTWRRLYQTHYPDPLGYGPGLSRFSDPTGKAFGLVYLGSSAKVAFVETILRDQADGRGADCLIELAEIEKRSIATIVPTAELR